MNFPSSTIENVVKLNQYDDNIKFEDFYDVIINIKSIKNLNEGWEIKMNEIGKIRFEEYKKIEALYLKHFLNSLSF